MFTSQFPFSKPLWLILFFSSFSMNYGATVFNADIFKLELGSDITLSIPNSMGELVSSKISSSNEKNIKSRSQYERCAHAPGEDNICLKWEDFFLNITVGEKSVNIKLSPSSLSERLSIQACVEFGNVTWFEADERYVQVWPINDAVVKETPFLAGYGTQSVLESLWLNSGGVSYYVSPESALFVSYNDPDVGQLCFTGRDSAPYKTPRDLDVPLLDITVDIEDNIIAAQMAAVNDYLGKPSGHPDQSMFEYPIYSSWVRYYSNINQTILQAFANDIIDHGFPMGQFEIDDRWEPCYGAWEIDQKRFPNFTELIDFVHSHGGHATAWIYPFVNVDCNPWFQTALDEGRVVKNETGDYLVNWWTGTGAAVDFTNETTAAWYIGKLEQLKANSGLDSFKFDAGETIYLPPDAVLNISNTVNPSFFAKKYVEAVSHFQGLMEVRVGRQTQNLPLFVRMLDKDSRWGVDNGLRSLIPSLFAMTLAGYPFVLPDMIGGNAYGVSVSKELFIRWLQATTFMPSLQFSIVPWDYDDETVEISRKYVKLHADHINLIMSAAEQAVEFGTPINSPIWWIAPFDNDALVCNDEYLLANTILVAPVLEEGATSRDIYLPAGIWINEDLQYFNGPIWLRNYSAPLSVLPYFTKI